MKFGQKRGVKCETGSVGQYDGYQALVWQESHRRHAPPKRSADLFCERPSLFFASENNDMFAFGCLCDYGVVVGSLYDMQQNLHRFVTCLLYRWLGANLFIVRAAEMIYKGDLPG